MKLIIILIALLAGVCIGSTYYYYSPFYPKVTHATAVVYPTKNNHASGVITFTEHTDGLHINARITGLTPGNHGFHVHEFGNCACDDAICAGGHFNPTNQPHAGPDAPHRHVGDFGNITADQDGIASHTAIDKYARLNGPHSIIGRAVIIHAQEDDLTSQPSGDAGARVGCGVIGIAK